MPAPSLTKALAFSEELEPSRTRKAKTSDGCADFDDCLDFTKEVFARGLADDISG